MKKHKFGILGLAILLLAYGMRAYKISAYPVSLSMDEVNIGYNAYCLLKTGKDEWGIKFPLAFKSVGDYKPPVNVYLTSLSIYFFGLNEFAVRFPVVFLGSLTCIVVVGLLVELELSKKAALLGGFWLAVSPWHIHYSRGSYEAVTALFFLVLGLWAFLRGIRKASFGWVALSIFSFSISVWAYHSERLLVPIVFCFLLVNFRKEIKFLKRKQLVFLVVLLAIFGVPFVRLFFLTPAIKMRALSTSIMRDRSLVSVLHRGDYSNTKELIFDNDIYLIFRHFAGKYLNYYDLRYWFWSGLGYTPNGYTGMGLFYLVDLVLLCLGFWAVYRSKNRKLRNLSFFWFFAGPMAASVTMNEQHSLRALVWIVAFVLLIGAGWEEMLKRFRTFTFWGVVYFGLVVINMAYWADMYFRQYARFYSEYWQFGYKDAALYSCENRDKFEEIIISETFGSEGPLNTGIPYAYVLFYCQYDPKKYVEGGEKIDKVSFRRVNWKDDSKIKGIMMIGSPWDLDVNMIPEKNIIKTTYFLNGKEAFIYAKTDWE